MNKLLSCCYNMDTDRVESRFVDGSAVAIDCIAIEDEYGNTPAQRAELDWLLYNRPLEYAQLGRVPKLQSVQNNDGTSFMIFQFALLHSCNDFLQIFFLQVEFRHT